MWIRKSAILKIYFMNILQRIASAIVKAAVNTPFVQSVTTRYGYATGLNKIAGIDQYKNWVYSAVSIRATAVGDIELFVRNGKTGEVVEGNDLDKLINKVNPYQTKKQLLIATQSYLDLQGNAYWFLARDKAGTIREIYILRPDRVRLVLGTGEEALKVVGYVYKGEGGKQIPLDAKEVLHFKNFDPAGNYPFPHTGLGVVQSAQWAIQTDNEIRNWNLKFFQNSARPDGILEVSGENALSAEEYKRINAEWEEEHKGTENSHKTAVLSGGVTWKPVTPSQVDMQFIEQKKLNMEEILGLFKVPKILLGMTEGIQRSNADASIYMFNRFTIKPLMQEIVDTLNEYLVPEFTDKDDIYFDFVSPVTEDRAQVLQEYSLGIDKWLSRNEVRAREGLPPTKDGDKIMGTFSQVPIDETTPEKKKAGKPMSKKKTVEKKTSKQSIAESVLEEFSRKKFEDVEYKHVSPETKEAYSTEWKARLNGGTKALKSKLEVYFEKQEAEVQRNLKAEMKKGLTKKGVKDVMFDMDKAVTAGITLITPFIQDYLKQSGDRASDVAGGEDFDDEDPKVQAFVKERAKFFAAEINNTTREDVLKVVQEGIDESLTLDEISEKISAVYEIAKGSRTDMIARTEVSAASNEGAKLAYEQAGVQMWEWMVVNPEDEDCKENEGVVVKIGDEFPDGSTQPPEPHPNCECTTLPVFEE